MGVSNCLMQGLSVLGEVKYSPVVVLWGGDWGRGIYKACP